jgi:hypothetical protein
MKTILSAQFANPEGSAVILSTQEVGAVAIQLPPLPDVSGGWREVYDQWLTAGHTPTPFPISEG